MYDIFFYEDQGRINLTDDAANDYFAALSPSFEHIAFISDRNGSAVELYLMNREGEDVRQLTDDGLTKGGFAWSLDSRRIAYSAYHDLEARWQVFNTIDSLAGQQADLIEFLSEQRADIFVIDVDTGDTVQLTEGLAAITVLAWNREMAQIAFVGEQNGMRGIYNVSVDNGDIQLVTELSSPALPTGIQWSPDSRHIAYITTNDDSYGLYIVEVETGVVTDLSPNNPEDISIFVSWTADSMSIVRIKFHSSPSELEMVNVETGEVTPIWEITARALCLENVRAANTLLSGDISTP